MKMGLRQFRFSRWAVVVSIVVGASSVVGCAVETTGKETVAQKEQDLTLWSNWLFQLDRHSNYLEVEACWDMNVFEAQAYAQQLQWTLEALEVSWEANARLDFRFMGQCGTGGEDQVRVRMEDGNGDGSSNVLDFSYPPRALTSGDGTWDVVLNPRFQEWQPDTDIIASCTANDAEREACFKAIAVHEFGHALGLAHTQNREDWGPHTTCAGGYDPAPQGTPPDTDLFSIDSYSIMSYCPELPLSPPFLSAEDQRQIKLLYGGGEPVSEDGAYAIRLHGNDFLRALNGSITTAARITNTDGTTNYFEFRKWGSGTIYFKDQVLLRQKGTGQYLCMDQSGNVSLTSNWSNCFFEINRAAYKGDSQLDVNDAFSLRSQWGDNLSLNGESEWRALGSFEP